MVQSLKVIIKSLLRRFDVIAIKRSTRIYLPEDESYRIAIECCRKSNPVIVDGGSHNGSSVDAFRALLPNSELHCFEPDQTFASALLERFSRDRFVHIVDAALGDESGTRLFNINVSRSTNSLLTSAEVLEPNLQELCRTVSQVEVAMITIDEYCSQQQLNQIDIVKLDLQGYDYRALVGARKTLRSTRVVLVEVFFTEIYQGGHLFPDILRLMARYGFKLFTLSGIHYGCNDELLWADAIFVKDKQGLDTSVDLD